MNANVNLEMNTGMSHSPNPEAQASSTTLSARVRPFYWSIRREIWENRSIYIAPIAIALVVLIGSMLSYWTHADTAGSMRGLRAFAGVPPQGLRVAGIGLYLMTGLIMALTAIIVGWFYCLDALYSERRERSILFWKSLPVSDTTAVLSKTLVGLCAIPLVALVIGVALFFVMLALASIVMALHDANGFALLANSGFGEAFVMHLYIVTAAILWSAPMYAWAIFVGSWAPRAPFLWALLPPVGIALAERVAFGTEYFVTIAGRRISGVLQYTFVEMENGFDGKHIKFDSEHLDGALLALADPARFLSQPALWIGLIVAAGFVAASIYMRRYREPL